MKHTCYRRNPIALIAAGLALLCGRAALRAQVSPQGEIITQSSGPYMIAGIVVSSTSGAPLDRTRVTITDARNPRASRWLITGEDGRFEFTQLAAGKYSIAGARRGFITGSFNQHAQFSTAIVTGPGLDTQNLTLRLVPAARITGTITDEAGEPVRNAQVRVFRENHGAGFSQISPAGAGSTDDRGIYEIQPVVPGTYYLSASAQPWYAVHPLSTYPERSENLPVVVDPSLDVAYPTTYYPGATDPGGATPIVIKGGDHQEIDVQLEPVPALHLIFHVANQENGFATPALLHRVFDSHEFVNVAGVQSTSPGTFEITGVPAGDYTIRTGSRNPDGESRATEMRLTRSVEELDMSGGEPLGSLKVSVKIKGAEKLPQQLAVSLRDEKSRNRGTRAVDPQGEVQFPDLPGGRYRIVASSPTQRFSVVQISSPGADTAGNSFDLAPGSTDSLTALLVGGAARVEGFAKRAGKPAAGAMVVLVPAHPETNLDLFRRDQSDSDGSFALPGVIPGSYTAIAIDDGWSLDWSRPEVLARYTPRGEKLTIAPDARGTLTLPDPVEVQAK